MVTSADMHRAYAKDLRFIARCLGISGAIMIALAIAFAVLGVNAAIMLTADFIGLVLAIWSTTVYSRARAEREYAKSLDDYDAIVDTRALWDLTDHRGAVLDGCDCSMCTRSRAS